MDSNAAMATTSATDNAPSTLAPNAGAPIVPTAPNPAATPTPVERTNSGSASIGGRAIMPTSQIEMTISCRNLLNKDYLSKSDPYCLVLMKDSWQEKFFELGRSETIKDSLSPDWVKKFIIDYNFEIVQRIRFEIWDLDPDGKDFLGYHETTLAEIVSFASRQYVRRLSGMPDKKNWGEIIIVTEELSSCKQIVQLQFAAEDLRRTFCGLFRPDPFFVISRSNEDGTFSVVIKSEPVRHSRHPTWLPITMRVRTLCNGDYERTIKIDCYDHRANGKHLLIGTCFSSLRELITNEAMAQQQQQQQHPPISANTSNISNKMTQVMQTGPGTESPLSPGGPKQNLITLSTSKHFRLQPIRSTGNKPKKPIARTESRGSRRSRREEFDNLNNRSSAKSNADLESHHTGTLILKEITVTEEITFIDYIKSGTQMHFAVAIDFTASNGPPRDPHSLHFLDIYGGKPNAYEIALRAVGEIIQQYDSAGMFPAFGFGAKLPPHGDVSHQFPLNGNTSHPYCSSINEIVSHYRNCLATVTLYGPTNFSLVIHNTAQIASKFQDGKHYFILLIITDGIISDMHQTKNALIDASNLPISIIIVGVGNADFAAMDELDSDDIRLTVDGRYAERDIVQFVPLSKFLSRSGPYIRSQAELAREVLAEIPDQMTGACFQYIYYRLIN